MRFRTIKSHKSHKYQSLNPIYLFISSWLYIYSFTYTYMVIYVYIYIYVCVSTYYILLYPYSISYNKWL